MNAVTVRPAQVADLAFVAQDGYVSEDRVARQIAAGEVWIAEDAAAALGYLRLDYLWGRVPYIGLIRVLPEHRGRGTGRALPTDRPAPSAGAGRWRAALRLKRPARGGIEVLFGVGSGVHSLWPGFTSMASVCSAVEPGGRQ